MPNPRRQGIFWIATVPAHEFVPYPKPSCAWIKGQLESGSESGYLHWQLAFAFKSKKSLAQVRDDFGGSGHYELSRSSAVADYVWKEDTSVAGTRFEFGAKPICRSSPIEWELVWSRAQCGDLDSIPASVRVQSYRTLRAIHADYCTPLPALRTTYVYWGPTGTGKSRRAWDEAGLDAYPKDPRTKFWCGYRNQSNIVIDEFRGGIDIAHFLRWLDRYPCIVEVKGSAVPLCAQRYWITSNIHPTNWYPDLDSATLDALLRRLEVHHFENPFG